MRDNRRLTSSLDPEEYADPVESVVRAEFVGEISISKSEMFRRRSDNANNSDFILVYLLTCSLEAEDVRDFTMFKNLLKRLSVDPRTTKGDQCHPSQTS